MTWFKVDDTFHAHPKVLATDADALGLWVVAGAWSSAHLTEGFVPDHALPRLIPGSDGLARKLVSAGLWRRTRGGYQFHDWTEYQPTREEAIAGRDGMSSGGALGNHRRWHVGKGKKNASCRYCQGELDRVTDRAPDRLPDGIPESGANPPARPVPASSRGRSQSSTNDRAPAGSQPPDPICPEHQGMTDPPPCGACAEARRARTRWDLADAERRRTSPRCPKHRGQPAHNCGLCRADELAAKED